MNSQNVTTDALTTMNENKLLRLGRRPDFFSPDFKHIREVDENNVAKSGSNRIVSNTPRNVLGDKTNEMLWSQKRPKRTFSAIETRRKSQKIAKTQYCMYTGRRMVDYTPSKTDKSSQITPTKSSSNEVAISPQIPVSSHQHFQDLPFEANLAR